MFKQWIQHYFILKPVFVPCVIMMFENKNWRLDIMDWDPWVGRYCVHVETNHLWLNGKLRLNELNLLHVFSVMLQFMFPNETNWFFFFFVKGWRGEEHFLLGEQRFHCALLQTLHPHPLKPSRPSCTIVCLVRAAWMNEWMCIGVCVSVPVQRWHDQIRQKVRKWNLEMIDMWT